MSKPLKITIVVPVYKAEKFLPRCIDSLLAQTYTDYSVVLVDDGSPDRSGEICDEYAQNDSRIMVIHQENSGANRAREAGVNAAKACDYITFVDSDDTLLPTALQELVSYAGDDYDIVVADYDRNDKRYTDGEMEVTEFVNQMYLYRITPSPCARLYRRTLFNATTFDLPRDFIMGEDFVMNLRLAFASRKKIRVIPTVIYHYNNNGDSAMNTFHYTLDYLAKSYHYKKTAIPEMYRTECMPYCIANVMMMNHLVVGYYYKNHTREKTSIHRQIVADIEAYGCRSNCWEHLSLRFSNPVFSCFYLWVRDSIIALKKIKRRFA